MKNWLNWQKFASSSEQFGHANCSVSSVDSFAWLWDDVFYHKCSVQEADQCILCPLYHLLRNLCDPGSVCVIMLAVDALLSAMSFMNIHKYFSKSEHFDMQQ